MKNHIRSSFSIIITIISIMTMLSCFYMFLQTFSMKYLIGLLIALLTSLVFIFENQQDYGLIKNTYNQDKV
jgi:hypothetical protein